MKRNVGILGLGIMGSAMAANLVRAGFRVSGYDPVAACRRRHARAGGAVARQAKEVFESSSIVITSLPSAAALLQLAREMPEKKTRTVVIETSTLPIAVKEKARKAFAAKGATLLDCPLSGTGAQAKVGDLVVFGSGDTASFRKTIRVLKGFSRSHYFLGRFGNGSKMKFAANLLVAIHNVSSAEAVILARRAGLDPALAVKVLGDGAGSSRMLQVRGPLMVKRTYRPATVTNETWQKDMKIIGDFVRQVGAAAPLFKATAPLYRKAMAFGFGKSDTAAICAVLEERRSRR